MLHNIQPFPLLLVVQRKNDIFQLIVNLHDFSIAAFSFPCFWSIGPKAGEAEGSDREIMEIYNKLENVILPLYYQEKGKWLDVMQHSIALNASFFNTHRMVQQYVLNAYLH